MFLLYKHGENAAATHFKLQFRCLPGKVMTTMKTQSGQPVFRQMTFLSAPVAYSRLVCYCSVLGMCS
jgi:hypothetical protein